MKQLKQEDLKAYVGYIKDMESLLYEQNMAKENLKKQLIDVSNPQYYNAFLSEEVIDKKEGTKWGILIGLFSFPIFGIFWGPIIWATIRFIIYVFSGNIISQAFSYFWNGIFWDALVQGFYAGLIIGGIFGVIRLLVGIVSEVNAGKDFKKRKYQIEKRNNQIKKENFQIAQINKQEKNRLIQKNNLINYEIRFIESNVSKTKNILDQAYALNIIHKSYRYNLSYICAIYGYLDRKQCFVLEGHEGAYNLLAEDIRYNKIIERLDTIITKLDQIRDTQIELYESIMEINQHIDELQQYIEISSKSLSWQDSNINDRINTIEYNQDIIAKNIEFQKWYSFFSKK